MRGLDGSNEVEGVRSVKVGRCAGEICSTEKKDEEIFECLYTRS